MKSKFLDPVLMAGMIVSWAIYYAVSKWAVGATGSAFLAGLLLRSAAFVFLTVQIVAEKKFLQLFRQHKTALVLMAIGVFGYLLDTFANLGYAYGSLSTGTALLKTDVLMVNLATVIFLKKKLYVSDWIGTFIMLFGVLMVLGLNFGSFSFRWTDLFFIASALSVTCNAFLIKGAQEKYKADTDMIAYYNNFVVLILFCLSSLVRGDLSAFSFADVGPNFWLLVLLGGLAQTLIYFFYYRNLRRHEVFVVKLYLLLMPILSCFLGVWFLGEHISLTKGIGIGVVLAGAAVILLRGKLNPAIDAQPAK